MKPRQIGDPLSIQGPVLETADPPGVGEPGGSAASMRMLDAPRAPGAGSRPSASAGSASASGVGSGRRSRHRGTRSRTIRPEGALVLSVRERDTVEHLDAVLRQWRTGWVKVDASSLGELRRLVGAVMQQGRWSGRRTLERGFVELGYDRLLLLLTAFGELTPEGVDAAYVQMREVAQKDPKGDLIKAGFLAFDGLARRLAEVCGTVSYSIHDNAPRDRLHALANLFVR